MVALKVAICVASNAAIWVTERRHVGGGERLDLRGRRRRAGGREFRDRLVAFMAVSWPAVSDEALRGDREGGGFGCRPEPRGGVGQRLQLRGGERADDWFR